MWGIGRNWESCPCSARWVLGDTLQKYPRPDRVGLVPISRAPPRVKRMTRWPWQEKGAATLIPASAAVLTPPKQRTEIALDAKVIAEYAGEFTFYLPSPSGSPVTGSTSTPRPPHNRASKYSPKNVSTLSEVTRRSNPEGRRDIGSPRHFR